MKDRRSNGGGIVATWRRGRGADEASALRDQLDRLTAENMRLRLEQQRPLSLGAVSARLAATVDALATGGEAAAAAGTGASESLPADRSPREAAATLDEAQHLLARAATLRATVLDVVQSLQVAAAQLERQLVADVPLTEVDRRVRPRRRADGVAAALHSVPEPDEERRAAEQRTRTQTPAAQRAQPQRVEPQRVEPPREPRVGGARA